jgi:adenylosuccinate lyase
MELNTLTAISPVDGRYRRVTQSLAPYFSEYGLIRYRVLIEVEYFIALSKSGINQLQPLDATVEGKLRAIYENFTEADALEIKETEKTTNHDVKAVEYFVKSKMQKIGLDNFLEFVHFGLTSQDINNTAVPLSLKEATVKSIYPAMQEVYATLVKLSNEWRNISMLAKTHGQPASPTSLGKEFFVFAERLHVQFLQLEKIEYSAKFGGATGNFNAHQVAFPEIDWLSFARKFVNNTLALSRSEFTTQIEHYDNLAAYFDVVRRINTILMDLSRDIWMYISMDYFKQKLKEGEVGSSAMPHKVNPIDFENAEGNLGIANAIFEHLSAKLPISRLQRDLTDSTVLRNIGVPLSHTLIALKSIEKGLDKLILNPSAVERDLNNNWAVVAEAIQTILRREGFPKPYEALKALTRTNSIIDEKAIRDFIQTLEVNDFIKAELNAITPNNYTGIIPEFKHLK